MAFNRNRRPEGRIRKVARQLLDKDILHAGRWRVGDQEWAVDVGLMRRLVMNFQRARDRGIRIPVVWNHSSDARDKVGEIVRLYLADQTLRARFWTASKSAANLTETSSQVSVEVVQNWIDGKGRTYDLFLTHLAIVTHPVVHPQGPIYRLCSATNPNSTGGLAMKCAIEEALDQGIAASSIDLPAMVQEVVTLVNEIVESLGASFRLDQTTPPEELVTRLRWLRDQVDALASDAGDDASLEGTEQRQLSIRPPARQSTIPAEIESALDRCVKEGRILPAEREELRRLARGEGVSLSLVQPFERIPPRSAVAMQSRSKRCAPSHGGSRDHVMSPDKVRHIVELYRLHGG
ncbi:phage protease [bacterium]|nr:phage protease [bacterium]